MMGSERLDKPHRKKRDGLAEYNNHPAKQFSYSEAPQNSAEALKSKHRDDVKKLYKAYLILSQETSSTEDVSTAFKTLISACHGMTVILCRTSPSCHASDGSVPQRHAVCLGSSAAHPHILAGCQGEQRLGALLVPKFAGLCPERLKDAIEGIVDITMVEAGPNSDVAQIDSSAILAIRGLALLAEAAAHEGQEKAMEKVVDQLFR